MRNTILCGDAIEQLRTLPDESVHCVVTSPPYWGLRDYGTATWDGGDEDCEHKQDRQPRNERPREGLQGGTATIDAAEPSYRDACGKCGARRIDNQLGLEATPEQYVENMVAVFREIRRVLRKDGTVWLNLGDSYASAWSAGSRRSIVGQTIPPPKDSRGRMGDGLKEKDLVGIPWRVAFALQADGWTLRSDVIWAKPNPMPESVTDRPTKSHEYIFMFSKAKWTGAPRRQFADISDQDARWLALFLDTEGNITVKRTERPSGNHWYGAQIAVASTNYGLLAEARRIIGRGVIMERPGTNAPMFYYQLSNRQAADLLHRIYPFLIVKSRQARANIYLQDALGTTGKKRPGGFRDPKWSKELERIWCLNKELNHFGDPDDAWIPEPKYGKWDSQTYYYDADAIREPAQDWGTRDRSNFRGGTTDPLLKHHGFTNGNQAETGRNKRTVWEVATHPYPEAHFATYPEELIRPCIQAGTSEYGCCADCGAPWERVTDRTAMVLDRSSRTHAMGRTRTSGTMIEPPTSTTTGWQRTCKCTTSRMNAAIVLDPFFGSGTTGYVAAVCGRDWLGIELNPAYVELAENRLLKVKARLL